MVNHNAAVDGRNDNEKTAADMTDEELVEAFRGERGIDKITYGGGFGAWTDDAGRRCVKITTSHSYGVSTAREIGADLGMVVTYNPHGSNLVLAEEREGMDEDEAREAIEEGFEFVNERGKTYRVTGTSGYFLDVETDDHTNTSYKEDQLVEVLVKGKAVPLNKECSGNAVTIYHANHYGAETDEEARDMMFIEDDVGRGDFELTPEAFAAVYVPAETVLGTTDLGEAYEAAQGGVVNREQGGRHMVCSASVGHVMLVHHEDGSHTYHVVEPFGFREAEALNEEADA